MEWLENLIFSTSPTLRKASELRATKGRLICCLFLLKFTEFTLNTMAVSFRNVLIISYGKTFRSRLLISQTAAAMVLQVLLVQCIDKYGPLETLRILYLISAMTTLAVFLVLCVFEYDDLISMAAIVGFSLYHAFFNMSFVTLFWTVAGDALQEDSTRVAGGLVAGGTAGEMLGALLLTCIPMIGTEKALLILCATAVVGSLSVSLASSTSPTYVSPEKLIDGGGTQSFFGSLVAATNNSLSTVSAIANNSLVSSTILRNICSSACMALIGMETIATARRNGISRDTLGGSLGSNQLGSYISFYLGLKYTLIYDCVGTKVLQFSFQLIGSRSAIL
jgi:hypothetical protein